MSINIAKYNSLIMKYLTGLSAIIQRMIKCICIEICQKLFKSRKREKA